MPNTISDEQRAKIGDSQRLRWQRQRDALQTLKATRQRVLEAYGALEALVRLRAESGDPEYALEREVLRKLDAELDGMTAEGIFAATLLELTRRHPTRRRVG